MDNGLTIPYCLVIVKGDGEG
jgi:hypothetical protein